MAKKASTIKLVVTSVPVSIKGKYLSNIFPELGYNIEKVNNGIEISVDNAKTFIPFSNVLFVSEEINDE